MGGEHSIGNIQLRFTLTTGSEKHIACCYEW